MAEEEFGKMDGRDILGDGVVIKPLPEQLVDYYTSTKSKLAVGTEFMLLDFPEFESGFGIVFMDAENYAPINAELLWFLFENKLVNLGFTAPGQDAFTDLIDKIENLAETSGNVSVSDTLNSLFMGGDEIKLQQISQGTTKDGEKIRLYMTPKQPQFANEPKFMILADRRAEPKFYSLEDLEQNITDGNFHIDKF